MSTALFTLRAGLRRPRGLNVNRRDREQVLGLLLLTPACVLIFGLIAYPLVYDIAFALSV